MGTWKLGILDIGNGALLYYYDYTCKTAKTLEEATLLIEDGFEYVTEMDGVKLFRKRK
jgi:hypothetical protein